MCCPFLRPTSHENDARSRFGLYRCLQSERTYLEMVEQRGMFPSPKYRQCTSDLKRGPIEKFIRSVMQKVILNCMGIRAEESHQRAQLSPLTFNQSLSTQQRTVYNWLPIFDRTLSDVLAWHW